jgi:hypothetical protein
MHTAPHTFRRSTSRTAPAAALVIGPDGAFRSALASELSSLALTVRTADSLLDASDTSRPKHADSSPIDVLLIAEDEVVPEELEQSLSELRVRLGSPRLVPILFGRPPAPERRAALRRAGTELALFGRFGRHALRFQVNRALAPAMPNGMRGQARAPMEWRTRMFAAGREKLVRCYSLSPAGGYFVTPRPFVVGAGVALELPSSQPTRFVIEGRIVYTHALGDEAGHNLPGGMAVAFSELDEGLEQVIRRGVAMSRNALTI